MTVVINYINIHKIQQCALILSKQEYIFSINFVNITANITQVTHSLNYNLQKTESPLLIFAEIFLGNKFFRTILLASFTNVHI